MHSLKCRWDFLSYCYVPVIFADAFPMTLPLLLFSLISPSKLCASVKLQDVEEKKEKMLLV